MIREEAKSCICTIKMLQRLAYNIHGVMDVIDADNCKKIIKALEQNDVLDEIRAEIEQVKSIMNEEIKNHDRKDLINFVNGLNQSLAIIDKYKAESEDKK